MIVTQQKSFTEILKHLKKKERIFIIGCGECATVAKTGGEKEVSQMKKDLEKKGFVVTGSIIPEAPCNGAQIKSAIRKSKEILERSDSILVMACGLGAQSVKENLLKDMVIHVSNNTLFMGQAGKNQEFKQSCAACGDCMLELTETICPVTRCAKGLVNGPCGGQDNGKCEVDKEVDCAWIKIYENLKSKDKLHLLKEIRTPKDHTKKTTQRNIKIS